MYRNVCGLSALQINYPVIAKESEALYWPPCALIECYMFVYGSWRGHRRTVYSRLDASPQGNAETGLVGLDRIALSNVDLLLFFSQSCTVSVVVLLFVMLADAGICIEQFWFRIVFITSHCTIKEDNYCVFAPPFDFMICLLLHCISYIGHVVEFDMIRDNNYFFCCSLLFLGHYLYMY